MTFKNDRDGRFYARILLKLKLTLIILTTVILQSSAASFAQITINEKSASLESILQKIRKQSGYDFFYSNAMLKNTKPVSINVKNAKVEEVLKLSFKDQPLTYTIDQKAIVLRYNHEPEVAAVFQKTITGKVVDEKNSPIPGASIRIKAMPTAPITITDGNGNFMISATEEQTLIVSFIGYETQEVTLKGKKLPLSIKLKESETTMKDVVINGMQTQRKDVLSGASAQFTGEQLKAIGNQNLIESIKTLDPSFIQIENNLAGSNPNVLPTIELRGQTSITTSTLRDQFSTDPNQPLFILDGFETSLRSIIDLDMNTVASISILKDASSTAVYGSRASNGVIVVETKKPIPGKLRLSYTTDTRFELPDLSSYNMMNATEKLEFERLAGRYRERNDIVDRQLILDSIYNSRLKEVIRGVNTYWLSQPIQTGFSHRHSLSASGGDQNFRYEVGVNYKANDATMIGSKRNDWGTNISLNYRSGIFNINNRVYISGGDNANSPYGSFSDWVKTNPYYRLLPATEKYLEVVLSPSMYASGLSTGNERIPNPFYNAALPSYSKENGFNINNNLQFIAQINPAFRFSANLQLTKGIDRNQNFVSPLNTAFDNVSDPLLKGTFRNAETNSFGYTANININYSKTLAQKHSLGGMLRTEFSHNKREANGYTAMGFPNASNGNPAFAYGFLTDSAPSAATSISRRHSIIGSFNYSYDLRYNIDINASVDGTTAFGSNKRYKPYYAIGASWNLHNEAFLKDSRYVTSLRLRGNIGLTGNQNFGSVSESVYNYYSSINSFGQGVFLGALGAPYLEQQQTLQTSIGIDGTFFKDRVNIQLSAYNKTTDPQVVAITLPSSTGLSNYPFNAGASTVKGLELISRVTAIRKPNGFRWDIGLTGSMYTQKYSKFNNRLDGLNSTLRNSRSLTRYRDGYSSYDLWAVPSLGIDPATGKEIFLRKDGTQTYNYNTDDIVVVASSKPTAEGVMSTNVYYKGFTAGAYFRYLLGKNAFNNALYEKVENISYEALRYNQDKRAFYGRWKNAGDVTEFKGISITERTEISSRFIQEENTITGESLSLGYEFKNKTWLEKAALSTVSITGYTNDLFYSSTVRRERGTDYPFARSFSLSLRATFK